jgi:hypothetical protein
VLNLALQIANDILPFDAHRAFIANQTEEEIWHFTTGFMRGADREAELRRSYSLFRHLGASNNRCIKKSGRLILLQRLKLRGLRATGYLSVSRPIAQQPFTPVEVYQLQTVASLVEQAIQDENALVVLNRLLLETLDARLLIGQMPFDDIV